MEHNPYESIEPKEDPNKPKLHNPNYWVLYRKTRFVHLGKESSLKSQDGTFIVARDPDKRVIKMLQKSNPGTSVKEMSAKEINRSVIP